MERIPLCCFNLERATGIEPVSEAWEASILPLYDARSANLILLGNGKIAKGLRAMGWACRRRWLGGCCLILLKGKAAWKGKNEKQIPHAAKTAAFGMT